MSSTVSLRFLPKTTRICLFFGSFLALAACQDGQSFSFKDVFAPRAAADATGALPEEAEGTTTERDVEAPEVFSKNETGLWDGRPSLGGVWVAHPDVKEPERVIIRNTSNGEFVVGALFRREREQPGPLLQLSSDAAEAIGVLAGAPVELEVIALRKEVVEIPPEPAAVDSIAPPGAIAETSLDPIAAAGAAIEASEATPAASAAAAPAPAVQSSLPETILDRPFLQAGIFSTEANAKTAADRISSAGAPAAIKAQTSSGKQIWRVVVGPAGSTAERGEMLAKVKAAGFSDAYPVSN